MSRSTRARWLLALLPLAALTSFALLPGRALAEDAKPAEPDPDETRGYVGYTPSIIERLTPEARKELSVTKEHGFVVSALLAGGPAEKAGLERGDILVKINGQALPDTKGVDVKNDEAAEKFMKEKFTPITHKVKPGDTVEMVVERAGKPVTIQAVAVDKATSDALREAQLLDEAATKVPAPKDKGPAAATSYDFEKLTDSVPTDFLQVTGMWETRTEEAKSENHVLMQANDLGEDFAVVLVVADGRVYGDSTATVRFALRGGEKFVSGGIVVRAQDRKNWIAVRADGVSKTLRIVQMKDGKPSTLASVDIGSPKLKVWHTLEVVTKGTTVTATLDGTTKVEAKDAPWTSGWSGLVTQGDAETAFDDWKLTPAGK